MSATRGVTRSTKVVQRLEIEVNMGALPEAARLEKLRVTRKADGAEMWINLRDYAEDPEADALYTSRHYKVIEGYDPDLGEQPLPALDTNSLYSAEDLAVMQTAEIRKLPEWSRIPAPDRARLNAKQDYVNAILAARKPRAVADESAKAAGKSRGKSGRAREAVGE